MDASEAVVGELRVAADRGQRARLLEWAARFEPRRWAIEGATGNNLKGVDAEFPLGRNDKEWMKHTLWHSEGNNLTYKPVNLKPLTVDSIPPKVRTF